jgi:sugar O-acyltransferase (sialic acid O-acetyltransferase NeuD family)
MIGSSQKVRKLVIFGVEDFAEIAFEYFTHDSSYEVVAFTVDHAYLRDNRKFGLPVVPFQDLNTLFPPAEHDLFAAIVYTKLNRIREDVCRRAKSNGYRLASYISSRAFVWPNVQLGEHCFIFENNSIQPFVAIGDNVVLWCANQISHHSRIGSHCFLSGNVCVAGWVDIENYCFLGANSTLANNTRLGEGSWVSHGSSLSGSIPSGSFVKSGSSEIARLDEMRLSRALENASRNRKPGTMNSIV